MLFRLCLAFFLLIPSPAFAEEVPNEVTVNEAFEDSTYETGLTVSGGSIYCQEQDRYGTTGCSLGIDSSITFEFSEDVYEVGFIVGAVNNSYDVKYYYSDGTDETIQKSGQDNSEGPPWANMYDSFYKSFTDYNNDEANTDKFITKFEVNVTDPTVVDTLYWQYVEIPVTTTSSTTSSTTTSTTTTTTTTTVPPKPEPEPEPEPEPYIPPPPPPPTPQEIIVDVKVEGVDKTYTQADVNDGTIERDQERVDNEKEYGCFMTNAQIERGDCDIPEPIEEDIKDDIIEENVVIKEDIVEDKKDVDVIIPEDDVVVLDPPKEEVIKDEVMEFEEPPIEFEIIEFDMEDIAPEIVVEIPVQDEIEEEIKDEKIEEDVQEVLDDPIQEVVSEDTPGTTLPRVEDKEPLELTEEEVSVEVAEVQEIVEEIVVEEATVEEVVEVLEQVNDIGVQNLDQATEEVQEIVQAVVEEAIADVEELTEEQVEVVAEVLQVEAEDVELLLLKLLKKTRS